MAASEAVISGASKYERAHCGEEHCGDAIHSKAMGLIDMGDCTALNDVDKACFNEAGCEAARTEVNGVCPGTFA